MVMPSSDVPPPDQEDHALLQAAAAGDDEAFRALVERHAPLVRGTIYRMGWKGADLEDLAQQVFLRVWKAAGKYRPEAQFSTWLLIITRNVVFSEGRRRARHATISLEEGGVGEEADAVRGTISPVEETRAHELQAAVDAALAELPPKQAMALVLHRFEGRPHEEIARVLGTTVPSVKSLIFRAREVLRKKLAAWL
jgi:RNA polymerase sigma-70 factor (ECF subfamily)